MPNKADVINVKVPLVSGVVVSALFFLTEITRVFSAALSLPVGIVNLIFGLLAVFSAVLLKRGRVFLSFFTHVETVLLFVIVLPIPLFSVTYSPVFSFRDVSLLIFQSFVLVSVYSLFLTVRDRLLFKLVFLSLAINVFLGGVSIIAPFLFDPVAELTNDTTRQGGRAFGLFMQPNVYGSALIVQYLVLDGMKRPNSGVLTLTAYGMCLLGVLISGSRLNILLLLLATLSCHYGEVWNVVRRVVVYGKVKGVVLLLPLFAILGIGIILLSVDLDSELGARLVGMSSGSVDFNHGGQESKSLGLRILSQLQYLDEIQKSPIWGYGLSAHKFYLDEGVFFLSAHNTAIDMAFQFGVPYLFLTYLWYAWMLFRFKIIDGISDAGSRRYLFFLMVPCAMSLNHGLYENYFFYVALGAVLGIIFRADSLCSESKRIVNKTGVANAGNNC